jgi:hypothetical protein
MKQLFIMAHDTARANAVHAVENAPAGSRVEIKPPKRTLPQNDAIHGILTEWGNHLGWEFGGRKVDIADLKVIAMSAYRKTKRDEKREQNRFVIGLCGEPVDLALRTSDLDKEEGSEFIDMIQAIVAGAEI